MLQRLQIFILRLQCVIVFSELCTTERKKVLEDNASSLKLSTKLHCADVGWLCPKESLTYNVVKWLIALTWTHHPYLLLQWAEELNKQCRRPAGWADKAEQTEALTASRICRSYLHNLFDTDGFTVIQLLCGCLKREHTSKAPRLQLSMSNAFQHCVHKRDLCRKLNMLRHQNSA